MSSLKPRQSGNVKAQQAALAQSLRASARISKLLQRPTGSQFMRNAQLLAARRARAGGELKFFDTALSFNIDATGEVPATGQLNLIPQGVTESTRIGRKCVLKSILIKMNAANVPGAGAQGAANCSIFLIQDTQTNGAAAAATDVFTGTNFTLGLRNLSNGSRFRILKEWNMTFNPTAGVTTAWSNTIRHLTHFAKLNIPLEFSSTAGALTELRTNNLFLMASTDGNEDDLVSVAGNCRVRFSDV